MLLGIAIGILLGYLLRDPIGKIIQAMRDAFNL